MIDILNMVLLQDRLVVEWHQPQDPASPDTSTGLSPVHESGLAGIICQQHQFNFLLWHEEDKARCPVATDATIAQVKRSIDRLNQSRNDWIEKIDYEIQELLDLKNVVPSAQARRNTETPGAAIDRLSIISLRLYHLQEEFRRVDADVAHQKRVEQKWEACRNQREQLIEALQQLVDDIGEGEVVHRVFCQHKMYNDPTLNPAIYGQRRAA